MGARYIFREKAVTYLWGASAADTAKHDATVSIRNKQHTAILRIPTTFPLR